MNIKLLISLSNYYCSRLLFIYCASMIFNFPNLPLQKFLMWLTCVKHMWSSKNTCASQIPCVSRGIIFTCETHVLSICVSRVSHVKSHMWKVTCEISHVTVFHMGNSTCEISHVKHHMWNITCEISHVIFQMWNSTWEYLPVKFHKCGG